MSNLCVYESKLTGLDLINRGKVRDIYDVDGEHLLIIATDRLSAFDVVFPDPIYGKGQILNHITNAWFERFSRLIDNHLVDIPLAAVLDRQHDLDQAKDRSAIVRKLKPVPVEAIVRGYLAGSSWLAYQQAACVGGIKLPPGLLKASKLPKPIYTPSTKAKPGEHDVNITFEDTCALLGRELAQQIRDISLSLYQIANQYAQAHGLIVADTKFEFGLDQSGQLVLIDEVLTPDCSRFWLLESYVPGEHQASFDKQFVRDYLQTTAWDPGQPAPKLPSWVAHRLAEKYRTAKRLLA